VIYPGGDTATTITQTIDLIPIFIIGIHPERSFMNIFRPNLQDDVDLNIEDYIIATYFLSSQTTLRDAAWQLAIGQSLGNPSVRSKWESEELFHNHSCIIIADEDELKNLKSGVVEIAFPLANIDMKEDGVSQLLCHLMGGQMDIDNVETCHLLDIDFPPEAEAVFKNPFYGIEGVRTFTGAFDKPLLGGIVKPKVANNVDLLLDITKELIDGGVNFIKEDEIMANPAVCSLEERVSKIMDYVAGKNVIYSFCINGDAPYVLDRVKFIHSEGGNGVHLNFWSGLGTYKSIRELDLPIFLHFQKSGDKILTEKSHRYHIEWTVICKLAGLMGSDTIHAGMWGGYMNDDEDDIQDVIDTLHYHRTLPALSCGMHPGLVDSITEKFGVDYMANVGGAIHGHPMGSKGGAQAMRQAIDKNYGKEYDLAIEKWGKK